jgi:hypothetical protein
MMAALTKNATDSAVTESMVLNRMAVAMDASCFCNLRLCTRAECK